MTRTGPFLASREALLGAAPSDAAEATDPLSCAGAVVADSGRTSIMLATPGDLRRVDLWVGPIGLVLHGYHHDETAEVSGSFHDGRSDAVLALSQLLAPLFGVAESRRADQSSLGGSTGHLRELLHVAVEQTPASGDNNAVAVLTYAPDADDSRQVVVVGSPVLSWCEVGPDETVDLRTGALAKLWNNFLSVLDPIGATVDVSPR